MREDRKFNQARYINDYRSANYASLSFSVRPIIKTIFESQLKILKTKKKTKDISISKYMTMLADSIDMDHIDMELVEDIVSFKKVYKEDPVCIKAYVKPETKQYLEEKAKEFGERCGLRRNAKSVFMTLAVMTNSRKFRNDELRMVVYSTEASENLVEKKEFQRYNRTYRKPMKYVVSDEVMSKLGTAEEVKKRLKLGDRVCIYKIPHTVRTRLWMSGHTGVVEALYEKTAAVRFDPFPEAENLGIDLSETWYVEYETIEIIG